MKPGAEMPQDRAISGQRSCTRDWAVRTLAIVIKADDEQAVPAAHTSVLAMFHLMHAIVLLVLTQRHSHFQGRGCFSVCLALGHSCTEKAGCAARGNRRVGLIAHLQITMSVMLPASARNAERERGVSTCSAGMFCSQAAACKQQLQGGSKQHGAHKR